MADVKFSEFPNATESKDSDKIAILQDGVNKTIASPILESKIIIKTASILLEAGGISLNLINMIGKVPTYADLATITPTPNVNDAYQVESDGLVYVYTEDGFQGNGDGFDLGLKPDGEVKEDDIRAVSGGEVYAKLDPLMSLDEEVLTFSLTNGRVNMVTGGTDITTVNWLSTQPITVISGSEYTISGYGNGGASASLATRIVCRQGNTVIGSITGGYGDSSFTFTTLSGTDNIKINIEALPNVGSDVPNSPFWDTFKITHGEYYLRAEEIKGTINTPQINEIEETVTATEENVDFLNTLVIEEYTTLPIITTNGYTTRIGTVAVYAGYKRTSVSSASSMATYDGVSDIFFTGNITSTTIAPNVAGVCYFNESFVFLGYECGNENNYNRFKLTPLPNTKYIACCSYNSEPVIETREFYAKSKPIDNAGSNVFYVSKTGSDENTGSLSKPFLTINKAITQSIGKDKSKIVILEGIYRETLNFVGITSEDIEIVAEDKKVVNIFGSDALTGFVKTSGRTNVYETALTTAVPTASRMQPYIFEEGRGSNQIVDGERVSLQRGLAYRLPFTAILPVASIALVDSTPNSYFHDLSANKVYIHNIDSSNPSTSGFSYEIIRRPAINSAYLATNTAKLTMQNINFRYTTNLVLRQFKFVERYFCSSIATLGDGAFVDNTQSVFSYNDETAYANGDGINGHMTAVSGYTTLDQREGVQNGIYFNSWCHDNFDDGLSFHERANTTVQGGLFEYNGDGGIRQSNDAIMRVYNALSRRNGWDLSSGTKGSGFDMVNLPSANRLSGRLELFNCISENNRRGIGLSTGNGILNAYSCITRNNTEAEYFAESGALNAYDCGVTNSDPLKRKVISGSGVINVLNSSVLT